MVWVAVIFIWISTLVFTGWVFTETGSPWSFAILLLLAMMNVDGEDPKKPDVSKEQS